MTATTLIVPGLHGSGPAHWQTWLEANDSHAKRIGEIDWENRNLALWIRAIRQAIDTSPRPVWLVAHSFGCLATVIAGTQRADRVAGAMLVAPADPMKVLYPSPAPEVRAKARGSGNRRLLPLSKPLAFPSLVVASSNDPWMKLMSAAFWARCWGSRLVNIGLAGHINADSGYGPWPKGLELLRALQNAHADLPLGTIQAVERADIPKRFQSSLQHEHALPR